jgi:hypothetical protein
LLKRLATKNTTKQCYVREPTQWSRVLLEKLIVVQLVEKFLAFNGTVFTRAHHWYLF